MKNGVTHTILERERMTLDATILPQVLKTAGYTTGIFGKWHLGDEEPYQPHKRGFDEAFIHGAGGIGQAYDCSCADAPGNKYFDPVIRHNGSFVKTEGLLHRPLLHRRPRAGSSSVKDSGRTRSSPTSPPTRRTARSSPRRTTPSASPTSASAKSSAGFYGMIENIDENMGRLLAKLEEWKLLRKHRSSSSCPTTA